MWLGCLYTRKGCKASRQDFKNPGLPGAPKPKVRVLIRRRIVQTHSKSAGTGAIAPTAATSQGTDSCFR